MQDLTCNVQTPPHHHKVLFTALVVPDKPPADSGPETITEQSNHDLKDGVFRTLDLARGFTVKVQVKCCGNHAHEAGTDGLVF
ncbi:hypothetical protein THICB2_320002 [Thiomonas sp. CB2]|nr:hypothetical protein THICB2_320002 [Thiomonas sp. CB2]